MSLRVEIPQNVWTLCEAIAAKWDVKPKVALRIFLDRISTMLESGKASVFGDEYGIAFGRLVSNDKVSFGGLTPIDVAKLARSNKTKSGFVGVYANGNGFRAMGRKSVDDPQQITLGTWQTGELAAWKRLKHYEAQGLPYGLVEEALDEFSSQFPGQDELSLKEKLDLINDVRQYTGQPQLEHKFADGSKVETKTPLVKLGEMIGFDVLPDLGDD